MGKYHKEKWRTTGIIGGSCSNASRPVLLLLVVKSKPPPSFRSKRSYQIIHKAEKQLLYECIRNINGILAMLDKQKQDLYCKFKNSIFGHNQPSNRSNTSNNNNSNTQSSVSDTLRDPDQELILQRARYFIHKIRDLHHNKIRNKQIDKFAAAVLQNQWIPS